MRGRGLAGRMGAVRIALVALLVSVLPSLAPPSWAEVDGLGWLEGEGVVFAVGRRGFALAALHVRPSRGDGPGRAFLRLSSRVFRLAESTWRADGRGGIELSARLLDLRPGDGEPEGPAGTLRARIARGADLAGTERLRGDLTVGNRRWRLLADVRCEEPRREGPAGGRRPVVPATEDRARRGPMGPPR